MVTIGPIAALIAGAALVAVGLRGRRIGDETARCACGHGWTSETPARCPQCGRVAGPSDTAPGLRQRRQGAIYGGLLLLLMGAVPLAFHALCRFTGADPYEYYPDAVVVHLAGADDARALAELRRRLDTGFFGGNQNALADRALNRHDPKAGSQHWSAWSDVIAMLLRSGALSQPQSDRYFRQSLVCEVTTRPRIRLGEPQSIWVRCDDRGSSKWRGSATLSLDGADPVPLALGGYGPSILGPIPVDEADVGRHERTFTLRTEVLPPGANAGAEAAVAPLLSREWQETVSVEVLPPDAPDPVRLVDAPELRSQVEAAIAFKWVAIRPSRSGDGNRLQVYVEFANTLPMDVAFDVTAIADQHEFELGSVASSVRGGPRLYRLIANIPESTVLNDISIVMESSTQAASQTDDCYAIWSGTLRFDAVAVDVP